MSTAHRPTWDPAQAKDVKGGSRQFSVRDMAAHTKLKFRQSGQTSAAEVQKRDLRAELLAAEHEAQNKKRKAEGRPPLPALQNGSAETPSSNGALDEEANKRRKLLQEALEMDKDDSDEEGSDEADEAAKKKKKAATNGKGKEKETNGPAQHDAMDEDDSDKDAEEDEDESDDEDDDDDTAELLRELNKIKRERAEEKERLEREQDDAKAADRDMEIATANPLLNLAAALGQNPTGVNTTVPGTFSVKRRWDDDLIFKNQAMSARDKQNPGFVNDLLRTEFHKKFMAKFIK